MFSLFLYCVGGFEGRTYVRAFEYSTNDSRGIGPFLFLFFWYRMTLELFDLKYVFILV
jgi:hypothetical protein